MTLIAFTIVLDGKPYIERHLPIFEQLKVPWKWIIAEGASANTHDTRWCRPQSPRLSRDGTTEYLNSISNHPNVKVIRRQLWDGKVSMCNACLEQIKEPCALLQLDSDEIYTPEQLQKIHALFIECPLIQRMVFKCFYHYGNGIIVDPASDKNNHWLRAWRFMPGARFLTHEPPNLAGNHGLAMSAEETAKHGLIFEHFSYCTEAVVAFKQNFYGYKGLVESWKRLQSHTKFPCKAREFFPFASESALLVKR